MINTLCLAPAAMAAFVGMLDDSIIEIQETDILIHAAEQTVEWHYIEEMNLFAVDGDAGHCKVQE